MGNLVSNAQAAIDENRRLREQAAAAAPKSEPEKPKKRLEERILESPEEAILEVIQNRFGDSFTELQKSHGESVLATFRIENPDFREYEDDVRGILEESGASMSKQNIQGAYLMAVGKKNVEERRRSASAVDNPERSGAKPDDAPAKTELSSLEKDAARATGISEERYAKAKAAAARGEFNVKVPTGKKEKT